MTMWNEVEDDQGHLRLYGMKFKTDSQIYCLFVFLLYINIFSMIEITCVLDVFVFISLRCDE